MASESVENYLATVYRLTRSCERASTKDIARDLGLSAPSVSEMVARLASQGYLTHEWRQGVALTDAGRQLALRVLRRHRLIETFLVQSLHFAIDEVDEEACRLEHAVSDRFTDALDAMLGFPQCDPHGHPIPTRDGEIVEPELEALSEVPVGRKVIVRQIDDQDEMQLRYLVERGVVPGAALAVAGRDPVDGALLLAINNGETPLARAVAEKVGVTPEA